MEREEGSSNNIGSQQEGQEGQEWEGGGVSNENESESHLRNQADDVIIQHGLEAGNATLLSPPQTVSCSRMETDDQIEKNDGERERDDDDDDDGANDGKGKNGEQACIMQITNHNNGRSSEEEEDGQDDATHHVLIPNIINKNLNVNASTESLERNDTTTPKDEHKHEHEHEAEEEEEEEEEEASPATLPSSFDQSVGSKTKVGPQQVKKEQINLLLNSSTTSMKSKPKVKKPLRSSQSKPKESEKRNSTDKHVEKDKDLVGQSTNWASSKVDKEKSSGSSIKTTTAAAAAAAASLKVASLAPRIKSKERDLMKFNKEVDKEKPTSSSPPPPPPPPPPKAQAKHSSPTRTTIGNGGKHVSPLINEDKEKPVYSSTTTPSQSPSSAKPILAAAATSPLKTIGSERIPNRTSPSKPPSRFMDLNRSSIAAAAAAAAAAKSPSSSIVTAGKAPPEHQRRASLEGERVHSSVKDFFHRRKSSIGIGSRKYGESESIASSEHGTSTTILARENPDLGPFLLKLAKQTVTSGDNPQKALDYAARAAKSFESAADGKPSLDLVMSLHILAAIHCTLGQFEEAIPVLERSIRVPDIDVGGQDHALAAFAGNMQLGDTYALLGRGEDALAAYHAGLEVQKRALGDQDPRVGETCRYLAEAHAQAMQFDKAEELCQHALDIHKEHSAPASIEEATDRRLMGLICNGKGQFEAALEHLVLASMALIANNKDVDVATVDVSIGDTYVSLGRSDEAVFAYQKALTVFKSSKGENHVSVASVYVSLAEAYLKIGKIRESKTYCESALRIYNSNKQGGGHLLDEVASGLTDLAVVYESLNEQEQALSLLKKALSILESVPGQQSAIAGVEAQIGVLSYMCGNYVDAHGSFSKAIMKLRASVEKNSALFGIVLNQMGLCCLHLSEIERAVKFFEESRLVLELACGPHHPDTLIVYSNLAGAYDALGRLDDAINALQYVVEVREEELGTAEPEVDDERNRLSELLKEAGRLRARRLNNTLALLMHPKSKPVIIGQNATISVPVNG